LKEASHYPIDGLFADLKGTMVDPKEARAMGNTFNPAGTDRVEGGMTKGVRDQIVQTLREFGFTPKGRARVYQKPYLEYYNIVPYPQGFRMPDFAKFNGGDSKTTYEHIAQFLVQINDMGMTDVHKARLFPLSLSGTPFNLFTSLAPNSIDTWALLEQKFHDYFYNGR
jgi:hypothetical protein